MLVQLMTYKGDVRKVRKTFDAVYDMDDVYIKEACDTTKPIFIFSLDSINLNPIRYNYIKVYWGSLTPSGNQREDLAKCYFIERHEFDGNIVSLHCLEDVLYTFQSDILALTCNVIRQEHKGSAYIPDDRILASAKRQYKPYPFPNMPFATSGSGTPVVLTVSGGV